MLRDELRQRSFKRTDVVLDHLMENGAGPGEIHFFRGEYYRLRGEEGDGEKALAAYKDALENEGTPPETYRALGLMYYRAGDTDEARAYFSRYLEAAPEAEDRAMIRAYLDRLR